DRLDLRAIPVGAVAHLFDRRLGRANQLHDLGVRHFRVVLQEPCDRVRAVLAAGDRGVAGAALLHLRQVDALLLKRLQDVGLIRFALGDLFAREEAAGDRIDAADALGDVLVGDALHFERVQTREFGDLLEGERGVFDQPHGGGLRHQDVRGHERGSRYAKAPGVVARRWARWSNGLTNPGADQVSCRAYSPGAPRREGASAL